jgi:uncharacterized coiled-coil protein SlyX
MTITFFNLCFLWSLSSDSSFTLIPKYNLHCIEMSRQLSPHVSPSTSTQGPTPLMAEIIREPALPPLPSVVLNREARHRTSQEAHYWDAYEPSLRKDYSFVATINRRLFHVEESTVRDDRRIDKLYNRLQELEKSTTSQSTAPPPPPPDTTLEDTVIAHSGTLTDLSVKVDKLQSILETSEKSRLSLLKSNKDLKGRI